MRLILHIGSGKTGTSTLQSAMSAHAEALLSLGILYPTPMFDRINHNYLAALVHPMEDMPREFTSGNSLDISGIRARGRAFWEDVKAQVRTSGAETVVLSGEYFFGLGPAKMERLHTLLTEMFDDIHVVAYVRHPATFYVSWMQQIVKASHEIRPPGDFTFRGKASLTRYEELYGGRLTVRSSHRSSLVNGSIVHDFVSTVLGASDDFLRCLTVVDVNESMSAEAMCIMQSLRRHGWPDRNGHFAPESTHIEEVLNELRRESPQSSAVLRPAIHAAMTQRHQADLDWLASRHGVVFDTEAPSAGTTPPESEPEGWRSGELRDILVIDAERLERTMHVLLKHLAARSVELETVSQTLPGPARC